MTTQSWFVYLTLVLVATSTPGPAVLLVMTNSTLYGRKKAILTALGNIVGIFCLGVLAVTGLGAILKTSEMIFSIVKYAGAAYLCFLGWKLIFQKSSISPEKPNAAILEPVSSPKIFFQAMGVALSNPKAIVFLTALFPQFIDTNQALVPQFSMLIATLMFFSFAFLTGYALVAYQAKSWLTNPNRTKAFNRTSGSLFIGLAVLLATSSNK